MYLIISGYKCKQVWAQVGGDKIWDSVDVKLLGVTIDGELKFDECDSKICSKASWNVCYLECQNFWHLKNEKPFSKLMLSHNLNMSTYLDVS